MKSPKAELVRTSSDITVEHEIHVLDDKSLGFHITEAHLRENLCYGYLGGRW
jgi:hypothetical protein